MPLDGHSYLISQGWAGKGTGLRHGAISRPLAIPHKRTLAGVGKDRDEAFPFWDHLFSATAKSIQLKVSSDSDSDSNKSNTPAGKPILKRTATGILSNRRPVTGTPASTSGTNTPETGDQAPRSSLLVIAKREAAKRGLYARFFRGAILSPECRDPDDSEVIQAGTEPEDVGTWGSANLESPASDKKLSKRAHSRDEYDEDKRRRKKQKKDLKEKQKEERKVKKELVRRGKEPVQEDKELRSERKRRRKREAKVEGDLASEREMEVQMVDDLSVERSETSRQRKKKKAKEEGRG